jgi:hypothetical protein
MVTPSTCRVLVFSFCPPPKSSGSIVPRTMGLAQWGCLHGSEGFHRDCVIQAGRGATKTKRILTPPQLSSATYTSGLFTRAIR